MSALEEDADDVGPHVLGDVELEDLGPTYAHEHLVIDGGRLVELYPDFLPATLTGRCGFGPARALVSSQGRVMPASAGRNVRKLPRSAGEVASTSSR